MGAKKWWERLLGTAAAALMLHTILLTFSRGALVGLLIVGASAFVIMPKRPKYLAALALALLIAVRFTGPQLAERYSSAFASADERDASSESRIDLWRDCFNVALTRPLFGVGPANFPIIAKDLGWSEGKQAHSVWMQTMAENGFPGVAALFVFFTLTVVKLWPLARMKQTPENRYTVAVATGIITSIVGFMAAGQFVSLAGLEIPYYTAMVGVVLLKQAKRTEPVPVVVQPAVRTSAPMRPKFALNRS
jgi:O-antigen ligase